MIEIKPPQKHHDPAEYRAKAEACYAQGFYSFGDEYMQIARSLERESRDRKIIEIATFCAMVAVGVVFAVRSYFVN